MTQGAGANQGIEPTAPAASDHNLVTRGSCTTRKTYTRTFFGVKLMTYAHELARRRGADVRAPWGYELKALMIESYSSLVISPLARRLRAIATASS